MKAHTMQISYPPSDLPQRRKRCQAEAQRLLHLQRETVTSCNVCSSPRHVMVTSRTATACRSATRCASIAAFSISWIASPSAGYSEFYSSGAYRTVSSQFNGVTHTIAQVQADQVSYAKILVRVLSGFVPRAREGKLLDVGGSAGIIAREFVKEFGLQRHSARSGDR